MIRIPHGILHTLGTHHQDKVKEMVAVNRLLKQLVILLDLLQLTLLIQNGSSKNSKLHELQLTY